MKYSKPKIVKIKGKLPPITTNFAPPPVEYPLNPDGEDPPADEPLLLKTKLN